MVRAILLALAVSFAAFAQKYPEPPSAPEPPLFCMGCGGTNSVGESNEGRDLWPYDVPVVDHVGRYVSSSTTNTVQHLGMRTIRAGVVRPVPSRNRIYMKMNTTLGVYPLDTFFTGRLPEPMIPVNQINTGSIYGGRNPFELLSRPDAFVYPEARSSGWDIAPLDASDHLADFDADDRGFVYYASRFWGWAIHQDDGRTDATHLPFVVQVEDATAEGKTLFSFKAGSSYYVLASDQNSGRLYDVTTASAPVLLGTRPAVTRWSKNDALGHVAVQSSGGAVRVYTYAALVANGQPLLELVPGTNRNLDAFSYDDEGATLWVAEASNLSTGGTTLWQLPASSYELTVRALDGFSLFRAETLHAAAGLIAVHGQDRDTAESPVFRDLRLLKVVDGAPVEESTKSYFRNHYHAAPAFYAQPGSLVNVTVHPRLVSQNGLTYLFYAAHGLGDVYELGQTLRPPNIKILSMATYTDAPSGGKNVLVTGRNFEPDMTVAFDGIPASFWFADHSEIRVTIPAHPAGVVRVTATTSDQTAIGPWFTFFMGTPTNFNAGGNWLTWTAAQNATRYEVYRRKGGTPAFQLLISTVRTEIGDRTTRDPDSVYFYYVRALDAAGTPSANSNIDWTLTTAGLPWAEMQKGMLVKASHLAAFRRDVDLLRSGTGLPPWPWTQSPVILAVHLEELRTAVSEARAAVGAPTLTFTDPSLTGVRVKAVHMDEMFWAIVEGKPRTP